MRLKDLSTMASFYGFLVLLACVSTGFGQDNDKQPSCTTVKMAYRLKRLAESDVPQAAVDGERESVPYQHSVLINMWSFSCQFSVISTFC